MGFVGHDRAIPFVESTSSDGSTFLRAFGGASYGGKDKREQHSAALIRARLTATGCLVRVESSPSR
jgi:hypothetical protein